MSILIKGMEMPTNCAACRIGYRDIGWDNEDNEHEIVFCPIIQQGSLIADANVERHPLCPLVPVPPHGRLGDLDKQDVQIEALIERHLHGYTKSTWDFICELRDILKHNPTVIPKESAEEEKNDE